MKILSVADGLQRYGRGGSTLVAEELARELRSRGHAVTLASYGKRSHFDRQEGILYFTHSRSAPVRVAASNLAISSFAAQSDVEILHSHFALYDFSIPPRTRRSRPVVRTFHGPWDDEGYIQDVGLGKPDRGEALRRLRRATRWWVERRSLTQAVGITVLSKNFRDLVTKKYGIPATKIRVIPGGVDTERFAPSPDQALDRRELGLEVGLKYLLAIRRLVPRMGLDLLIGAMPTLLRERPDVRLLIGGLGPCRTDLESQAFRLGVSHGVSFLGFVPDELLPLYNRAVDLAVVPTRALEGFGLVTLEALASGTEVVATPVGGNIEILEAYSPRLLASGCSSEALALAILNALGKSPRAFADRLATAAWARKRFSWAQYADDTEEVYHDVRR